MFKTLLKKQFLELNAFYFQDKRTGKHRSPVGVLLFVLLFLFVFATVAGMFFLLGSMLAPVMSALELGWLYFALMGLIALFFGVFGSVFNTYAGMYHAKDNELLLAMPIPPSKILLTRMVGVYVMGLLYEALVLVPGIVSWYVFGGVAVNAVALIFQILHIPLLGFVVLALTCGLGWLVALLASRIRNKSFFTVLFTLLFLAVYYLVYFKISEYLKLLLANVDQVGAAIKAAVYPAYLFGCAAMGEWLPMLATAAIAAALFGLTWWVLSRSFIGIVTTQRGEKKTAYRAEPMKVAGVRRALLQREWRRFLASPTYMLNCGLGVLLMPVAAVVLIVKSGDLHSLFIELGTELPEITSFVPLVVAAFVMLLISMNPVTAPSVSLEGKTLWIVQSLPARAWDVLMAKQYLHLLLNLPVALPVVIVICTVLRLPLLDAVCVVVLTVLFVCCSSACGLMLNLKKPILDWTNETVPVKQSTSVLLAIFGGWALAVLLVALYYPLRRFLNVTLWLLIWIALLAAAVWALNRWLKRRGTVIFETL